MALALDAEPTVDCQHFGALVGRRIGLREPPCGVYACAHPQHGPETTTAACRRCPGRSPGTAAPRTLPPRGASLVAAATAPLTPTHAAPLPTVPPPPSTQAAAPGDRPSPSVPAALFQSQAPPPQPPGLITNRAGQPAGLANLWYEAGLFVILSGPSLLELPLHELKARRGIMTLAVNNAAAVVRPTLWTHFDPPIKFHHAIWLDPGVLKLLPAKRHKSRLKVKEPWGEFRVLDLLYKDLPGVFFLHRNANFRPEAYLTEETCNFGNNKKHLANGHPHILNVMFGVFRLAHYLGFRRVYLLGCDFRMSATGPAYAFPQDKPPGADRSNNGSYLKLNQMLQALKPHFDRAGLEVYNCYERSGLVVFPYLSFAEALDRETGHLREPLDTRGWYEKS